MKVTVAEPQSGESEEIIIKCHLVTPEIMNLLNDFKLMCASEPLSAFKPQTRILIGYTGSEIYRIGIMDIFYIKAVDNKVFLYCEQSVHESKQKLYELEKELMHGDFLRISKYIVVNLSKVKSLEPVSQRKLEVVLINGEKVVASRQYAGELKGKVGV